MDFPLRFWGITHLNIVKGMSFFFILEVLSNFYYTPVS